jgi:hypothetical protein
MRRPGLLPLLEGAVVQYVWHLDDVPRRTAGEGGLRMPDDAVLQGGPDSRLEDVYGDSRADFLKKVAAGGALLLASLGGPATASPSGKKKNDIEILNFDLEFEYLQAHFYTEALRAGKLSAKARHWARIIGAHEWAHVRILKSVLGKYAVKSAFFDYHGITEDQTAFTKTAVAMEDLTTALLTGQIPRINSSPLVAALFSLITVEARHAAWVRHVVGVLPVATALDQPKSLSQVNTLIAQTNFMQSDPKTWVTKKSPPFTG